MIERKDIEHLANLSRIKLSEAEIGEFQTEIDSILGYVAQIQKVSGGEAKASTDAIPQAVNVFREDVPEREGGEYTEALTKAAPFSDENYVKVKNMF